ncbi:hypothetical protein NPIL_581801 [Nephila pilipes]|uniref:Uncharacterized protein n=1 Tax=Nephila pilipes TaxID=299642 RepID=A0A8X6PSY9_NEPPI|nr:hypothetical protein NPIL_581801 [Nephila pilipes]
MCFRCRYVRGEAVQFDLAAIHRFCIQKHIRTNDRRAMNSSTEAQQFNFCCRRFSWNGHLYSKVLNVCAVLACFDSVGMFAVDVSPYSRHSWGRRMRLSRKK